MFKDMSFFGWLKIAKVDQQFSQPYCKTIAQIVYKFLHFFLKKKNYFRAVLSHSKMLYWLLIVLFWSKIGGKKCSSETELESH